MTVRQRVFGITIHAAVLLAGSLTPALAFTGSQAPLLQSQRPSGRFSIPAGLRPQVEFWKRIFGTYSIHHVVIHDTLYLDRVYNVLDFRPLIAAGMSEGEVEQVRARTIADEVAKIRSILTRLHQLGGDPQGLSESERKIWALFRHVKEPHAFLAAAAPDRLRTQSGLKERFARGLEVGARYWPEIERIFREEGVPLEITRLPLVESCFNVRAYSKVGAAGVWQFMPSTGRRYLRIDNAVDERRDPIIAARAAARYLRADYEALGSWPLAITAYNHGRGGMARAVEQLRTTDITTIVQRYRGPAFKFASRNFYAEFLAALEVERNAAQLFGPLNYEAPQPSVAVQVAHYVKLSTLAECAGTTPEVLADFNPSFSREVIDGKLRVPRGYALRLPAGSSERFQTRYAALAPHHKAASDATPYVVHRVKRGQTLQMIARRYGTTVAAIQRQNNLGRRVTLRTGQTLQIPRG
jgi:membrane-bound lytic murein transglycosylase D